MQFFLCPALCGTHHPVFPEHILFQVYIRKPLFLQFGFYLRSIIFMDLEVELSCRLQSFLCQLANAAVKQKGIIIGHKQGVGGFKCMNGRLHACLFFFGDIRRVADDNIEAGEYCGRLGGQYILLQEIYRGMLELCIAACYGEGAGTYIHSPYIGRLPVFFKGDGDAPAAGSNVQQAEGGLGRMVEQYPFHQLLRFRAGDQYLVAHNQFHAVKPAFPRNVLDGPAGQQLFKGIIVLRFLFGGKVHILVHDAVQLTQAGEMFHKKVAYIGSFPVVVQGADGIDQICKCRLDGHVIRQNSGK